MKNKVEVKSVDSDGKEVVVYVVRPNNERNREAQKISNLAFKEAIESGALLRQRIDDYMEEQGLWNDEKEKKLESLNKKMNNGIDKLKKGGITKKKGREIALQIKLDRMERTRMMAGRTRLDEFSVEGQAENARFDCLVSLCVLNEEGEHFFESLEDYHSKNTEPFAIEAASVLGDMAYGLDKNWENKLPENQFLTKYNFINEDLMLINEKGELVSRSGKLIDEDGNYINDKGEKVDVDGNKVDDEGFPIIQFGEFK